MRLRNGWLALCEVLYASQTFRGSFAAVLKQRPTEVAFLTGAALSEAINKIKSNPAVNWTIPNLHPTTLTKRADPICDIGIAELIAGSTGTLADLLQQADGIQAADVAYYAAVSALINVFGEQYIDVAGDVAQSFYSTFAANSYSLVSSLIAQGVVQLYLQLSNNLYLNAVISLENLNAILPYCGDGTYDAIASRIASIVDAFISQYNPSADDTDISITVIAANVDSDTGEADGISLGGTFLWASGEEPISATCPVYGDVF